MRVRVVIVGAGIVGASIAQRAARAGMAVVILDSGQVGGGTTSRGEGNVLVSDKAPGPELELALRSRTLWGEVGEQVGADLLEWEPKGGLVVASSGSAGPALERYAAAQSAAGVTAERVAEPRELEPHLAPDLEVAYLYPQDAQVQPVLAAAALVRDATSHGAEYRPFAEVIGADCAAGRVTAVVLADGTRVAADAVVNAAGTWGAVVGERLGAPVPVMPRRGFVLVTEPLPPWVRRKVYSADYVDNVASSDVGLETSCVVEGTRGGTILIGASRERVGFDPTMSPEIVARLAAQACRIFPVLRDAHLMRTYRGFRPYCPDHLPVIGPDPRVGGVLHACGHEGAGVGLAPGTAELVVAHLMGSPLPGSTAFLPDRLVLDPTRGGGHDH
ncbi:NAD(P)/FAD-dependent oxidoreductase [Actinomycetota bacterium]